MSILPRPTFPVYEIVIPSLKKKVKYRPYLSKEEKVLSIAMESEDITEITSAIKMVLQNCIQTKDIDVEKLATFDIEYLFLNIRAKAVGEEIEIKVICPDDPTGETYVPVKINVNDIQVTEVEGHTNKIQIDDALMMEMRYPSFSYFIQEQFTMPEKTEDKINKGYDLIASCVDKIYKDDEIWLADDVGKEEVIEFLNNLTTGQFVKIQTFLDTMPQLRHEVEVENPNTGVKSKVTLSGMVDFFI